MPASTLTPRAQEMRALLRRHDLGESLESLAREVGLKTSTLTWWRSKLRRDLRPAMPDFVEVQVESSPSPDYTLVARFGELRVEIPTMLDEETLLRTLRALRRC